MIKKQITILSVFILLASTQFLSGQSWQWAKSGGGSMSDKGTDMDLDSSGKYLFVSGYFNSQATFGSINTNSGFGKQGLLAKLDSSGNWLWAVEGDGGWDERVLGMCTDKVNDYIYITGCYWTWGPNSQLTFGNLSSNNNPGDADEIFVGKFDNAGNCLWLISAGGEADDHGYDLVTDPSGNIYLTGFVSNEYNSIPQFATFGSLQTPLMNYHDSVAFIAKISPAGVFQWVKTFSAVDGERDNRIAIDAGGNLYVAGGFWGTKPFGTQTMTSNGGVDIFVVKFDSNGNQLWVKTTGSTYDDRANSITVDKYGDIYVTGEFRDHVVFGTDTINNNGGPGGRDIFVAKITQAGNWIWAKKAGSGSGSERGNRIVSNSKGNLFVTGEMNDTAKFGGNIIINNNQGVQVFVAAIDTSGKWIWAKQAGGAGDDDRGNGLAVDDNCNLYVDGYYTQSADFEAGMTLSAQGSKDIFVAKIKEACFDSTYIPPIILPDCNDPFMPTIFSPNNDGINDEFFVVSSCIKNLELKIFNRWGNLITTLTNNQLKWDGTQNGKPMSDGVYYYVGTVELQDGQSIPLKGFFNLVR